MSFIYNNAVKYSDSPNLDAFGRLRTSNVTSLLEYKHTYDKLPLVINEVTAGTATSVYDKPNSQVVMSVSTNNDYVIRQGVARGIYQPGKGQIFEASFSDFQLQTNVIKRVGYFTTSTSAPYNSVVDGFFLESNGQTGIVSFQIWQSGTTTFSAESTSWLTTDYDVTNINWSKTQLMFTDFQWLGVGRVRFGVVIDGQFKLFTTSTGTNNLDNVYMKSPNQPVRYEIRSVSAGASGSFNMICSQVSLEGSINSLQKSTSVLAFTAQTKPTAYVTYPILGYRLNTNYEGANITLSDIQSLNITNPSKADYLITIQYNPTLSSTSSWTNITDTPVQYSLSTGQTITTQGHIIASFMGSGNGTQVDNFEFKDNMLKPGLKVNGTPDEIWICVKSSLGNQDFRTSINLSYFD
jgi:hypothetical protein